MTTTATEKHKGPLGKVDLGPHKKWQHLGPPAPLGATVQSYCKEVTFVVRAFYNGQHSNGMCPDCLRIFMRKRGRWFFTNR